MHFYKILKHTIGWKLINTVLLFLNNLLMVRLLGVTASGSFFYDITALSFIVLITSWCLESGITYYTSKDNSTIASLLFFILPLLLIQGVVSWVIVKYFNFSINSYLAVLFIISNLAIIYFSAFFYAKKWFVPLNIIFCTINFVTTLALFYCWIVNALPTDNYTAVISIFIAGAAIQAFLLVMIILFSTKKSITSFRIVQPVIKNIFTYSSIAFISNLVSFLVLKIDYFFVQKYCSNIALSNYIQVSKFGQLLIIIPSIIGSIVFPLSAGNSDFMSTSKVQQLCRSITFIFIPVTVIIILTANWVFLWMFGEGFNYMYVATLLYMPGFFSLSIVTILAAHLAGKNLLGPNLIACILALVVVIIGDLWLVPIFGINAAAAVSSVAYITYVIYLLLIYKKIFNCKIADFFSFRKMEIANGFRQLKKIIIP